MNVHLDGSGEGQDSQPNWKVIGGLLALVVVVAVAASLAGWALAMNHYKDDEPQVQMFGDLNQALDRNRLGVVVGTTNDETCVVLLDDSFGPRNSIVCTENSVVLNYEDNDYGPSVLPELGDVFEIRYFSDRGVQEGLVFFEPGIAPKPQVVPTQPAVDVVTPVATPDDK